MITVLVQLQWQVIVGCVSLQQSCLLWLRPSQAGITVDGWVAQVEMGTSGSYLLDCSLAGTTVACYG